ncbi:ribonuclease H-like domain-containing protein [Lentinula raphanica]|nr:ribonuclease H-like domain-containing protein [Lentinula raphanica]
MASTAKAKIYTVAVFDTSKDRKTAEEFLKLIEKAYNKVKDEWKAVPIGFVSDASGESRKGRCMLAAKHPELVVMDCYAHQINLIVGDYFSKSNAADLHFTDQATDLITWLRSKTLILSHLAKAVIRAVLTRWTAHYLAFVRLIELREKLLELVYRDAAQPDEKKRIMKTGNAQAQKKAVEMISLIKNEAFWEALSSIVTHLEPLAIAANVIQAAHCRLDQVLLTFGYLFYFYSTMRVNDTRGRDAIISSIEARWKKCDQEVFIAAVILNPIYRNQAFSSIPAFNNAGIQDLMVRLWNRIFPDERIILDEFSNHLDDYLYGQGTFVNLQNRIDLELGNAMSNHRSPDPAQIFKGFTYPGMPGTQFIRLALRILGISANSASCERLFSVFGNTLTKLRNRLGVQTLTDLTELKMHIRDEHQRKAESKRLKRRFAVRGQKTRDEIQNTLQQSPHVLSNVDALNSNDTDQSEPRTTSFRSMMERNIAAVTDDEDDVASTGSGSVPLLSGTVHTLQSQGGIPIQKLFNFSNQRWINLHLNRTKANLTEELALYELLEAENDGDSNGLIDLDETNEDLLSI